MPKIDIDYSKTVVYMLCCKDPTIKDVYVGHTTSLTKRKTAHKSDCTNPKSKSYNLYVYEFIRENNGWNNWEMIVLETKSCIDGDDARKLEREWFEIKGATLNGCRPIVSKEEHRDEIIEYKKKYHQEHREEHLEQMKKYYQENRDERIDYHKKYYQENRDELIDHQKKYREENRDELNRKKRERYALKKSKK